MVSETTSEISFGQLCGTQRERDLFDAFCAENESDTPRALGRVIRLDRGFPLVCSEKGTFRAEHAVAFIKRADSLACVGDWVVLSLPEGHDMAIIESILPRTQMFSRKDPSEKTGRQVLAANVDIIFVLHALSGGPLNERRLEREMVMAHESGAKVVVVLTKADLATALENDIAAAHAAVPGVQVIVESSKSKLGIEEIRALIPPSATAVLLGSSGVGKSSLVNALLGEDLLETGSVREGDDKGRHTTVAREMFAIPEGGVIIDTPGIRSIALWDSEDGIAAAFPEIEELSALCRFRDCTHTREPGCAVIAAVEAGEFPSRRLESYRDLREEMAELAARQEVRARLDKKREEAVTGKELRRHYNAPDKDRDKRK